MNHFDFPINQLRDPNQLNGNINTENLLKIQISRFS